MTIQEMIQEIPKLSIEERIHVAKAVFNSLSEKDQDELLEKYPQLPQILNQPLADFDTE